MSERFNCLTEHRSHCELSGEVPFTHPDEVVRDPRLSIAEKKAILASWSSDARAVENAPSLRHLDSGAVVELDAILRALVLLDGAASMRRPHSPTNPPRKRSVVSRWLKRALPPHRSGNDDDDPPPAPAGLARPFRPTFVAAHGRRPEIRGLAYSTGCG